MVGNKKKDTNKYLFLYVLELVQLQYCGTMCYMYVCSIIVSPKLCEQEADLILLIKLLLAKCSQLPSYLDQRNDVSTIIARDSHSPADAFF